MLGKPSSNNHRHGVRRSAHASVVVAAAVAALALTACGDDESNDASRPAGASSSGPAVGTPDGLLMLGDG